MAPGSQEASFHTVEEETVPTSTVSKKSETIVNHLKSCGNMLRFMKRRRLKRGEFLLDPRRGSKRNMGFFSEERINPSL
jgi:hypothetical protein